MARAGRPLMDIRDPSPYTKENKLRSSSAFLYPLSGLELLENSFFFARDEIKIKNYNQVTRTIREPRETNTKKYISYFICFCNAMGSIQKPGRQ
jgi:hypothetical protein